MKKTFVFLISIFLSACQTAQIQKPNTQEGKNLSLEQVCIDNPCRKNIHISFRTDGNPVNETIPLYWPRVFNDVISVLPGESFFVEAELINGKLTNLREVQENKNPEKTIVIEMSQMEGSIDMMLSLSNPFEGVALKFNMDMIDFRGEPHQTSSCPVMPKASIFEAWPHPIPELIIKNPKVIPMSEMQFMECIY